MGEFPKAGVWEWTSASTGTCTWTTTLSNLTDSPVYVIKTAIGKSTFNASDVADGAVISGESGTLWETICPSSDVDCKRYGK